MQSMLKELGHVKSDKDNKKIKNIFNIIFHNTSRDTSVLNQNSIGLRVGNDPSNELEDVSMITLFDGEADSYLVEFLKGLGW